MNGPPDLENVAISPDPYLQDWRVNIFGRESDCHLNGVSIDSMSKLDGLQGD